MKTETKIEDYWVCDWCDKRVKEGGPEFYDARQHAHCSQECVDDHEANR